jgi:hypothetical protein
MPMLTSAWDQQVADGKMTADAVDKIEAFMTGPAGIAVSTVQQMIVWAAILFIEALMVWLGISFLLGRKFGYRLALEVTAWSSLTSIPAQIVMGILAWSKETLKGIHIGFGILVPEADPPVKMLTALAFFLDAVGPFAIWHLFVSVLGATALSGAPRKSVTWVIVGLYLGLMLLFSAIIMVMPSGM